MHWFKALPPNSKLALELKRQGGYEAYSLFNELAAYYQETGEYFPADATLFKNVLGKNARGFAKFWPMFEQSLPMFLKTLGIVWSKFEESFTKVSVKFDESLPKLGASNPSPSCTLLEEKRIEEIRREENRTLSPTPLMAESERASFDVLEQKKIETLESAAISSGFIEYHWFIKVTEAYPGFNYRQRPDVIRLWQQKNLEEQGQEVFKALEAWKKSEQWETPRFIPKFSNWIANGDWKAEPKSRGAPKINQAAYIVPASERIISPESQKRYEDFMLEPEPTPAD